MARKRSKQRKGKGVQGPVQPRRSKMKGLEFLKLPAEIRNMIYCYALAGKRYYYMHLFSQPPLTVTSKQIRLEVLPILYSNKRFTLHFEGDVQGFRRLKKTLLAPSPPMRVSAILNLGYVTKLDINFYSRSYWGNSKMRAAVVHIHMRKRSTDCSIPQRQVLCGPGFDWTQQENVKAVCTYSARNSLREWRIDPHAAREAMRWIFGEGMSLMVECLAFFAEKCPQVSAWVWMRLEIAW
ncbi:hypothetical protein J7T55_002879 [Diaporthe amygdali]|uniref:uncharacterized protein n=1 Tax=Phomopsis amygdali TaxID=1214568 RepID=UPI0022FF45FA|nr:uncharacterized protein J7T55_002879 [Diaporthe amygdali]KAJ0122366.1 hypothetical protein J7T55_002879 [Diaporthe amygdali]